MSNQHTHQELRQSFVDMAYMRNVLASKTSSIHTDPSAPSIEDVAPRNGPSRLEFRNVTFRYGKLLPHHNPPTHSYHYTTPFYGHTYVSVGLSLTY